MFIDFAGEKWFGMSWTSGPDLFPNQILGVFLALAQLVSAGLLIVATIKMVMSSQTYVNAALWLGLAAATALVNFVVYVLIGLFYLLHLMQRPL